MSAMADRIETLDVDLFSFVPMQEATARPRRRATRRGGARCTVGAERWYCDASSSAGSVHFQGPPLRVSSPTSRAEITAPAISAVSVSGGWRWIFYP